MQLVRQLASSSWYLVGTIRQRKLQDRLQSCNIQRNRTSSLTVSFSCYFTITKKNTKLKRTYWAITAIKLTEHLCKSMSEISGVECLLGYHAKHCIDLWRCSAYQHRISGDFSRGVRGIHPGLPGYSQQNEQISPWSKLKGWWSCELIDTLTFTGKQKETFFTMI